MSINITELKSRMSRKLRGASIDDVQGISDWSLFAEAAGNVLSKIDPYETVRHGEINLFAEVYDYSAMSDLKGKKVLDIRPQTNRNSGDNYSQTFTEDLDRDKNDLTFTVEFDEAEKFMRIVDKSLVNSITFDETTDDNWTAGTGVSNIAEDTILYAEEARSLRFDIASGTSYLEWNGDSTIDLSTHQEKSSFFRLVYLPDSSLITSIAVRVGSSSSAYWTITGTIHLGSIRNGWNLYRFDWNGATQTGTVDEAAMDYERVTIVSTSADTDIRIGRLTSKLPNVREVVYYSNALFRPLTGSTWLTTPTADSNLLNLENEAQNIFFYECCSIAASDLSDNAQKIKFDKMLHGENLDDKTGLYAEYKTDKPSEAMKPQTRFYRPYKWHGR